MKHYASNGCSLMKCDYVKETNKNYLQKLLSIILSPFKKNELKKCPYCGGSLHKTSNKNKPYYCNVCRIGVVMN